MFTPRPSPISPEHEHCVRAAANDRTRGWAEVARMSEWEITNFTLTPSKAHTHS